MPLRAGYRPLVIAAGVAALAMALCTTALAHRGRDVTVTGVVTATKGSSLEVTTASGKKVRCSMSARRHGRHHKGEGVRMTCRSGKAGRVAVKVAKLAPASAGVPDAAEVKVRGTVKAVDSAMRTVTATAGDGSPDVSCTAPTGVDLSAPAPGHPVEMRCVTQSDGTLALTRLREEDRDRAKIEAEGAFTASGTTVSVAVGTLAVSCEVPAALSAAVAALPVSARIEIECEVKGGKAVLEEVEVDPEGVEQEATVVLAVTPGVPPATTAVAVGGITCTVEDPALLGALTSGAIVEITCVAGKLARIHLVD